MIYLVIALTVLIAALYRVLHNGSGNKPLLRGPKKPTLLEKLLSDAFEHVPEDAAGLKRVMILYGTEYGFAKEVALKLAAQLADAGLTPRVVSTLHYRVLDLTKERYLALVCSTTGDGVPPNEAADFRDALVARDVVMPDNCRFAVLALGDRSYPHFCRAGIIFDQLFGENRLLSRVDVDQEDWPVIDEWIEGLEKVVTEDPDEDSVEDDDYLKAAMTKYAEAMENQEARYSRNDPFMASFSKQELLTAAKSGAVDEKEVIRVEFDISGSGMHYEVGDAVGVVPRNNTDHVNRLLLGMAASGMEMVRVSDKGEMILFEEALTDKLDIRTAKPELVLSLAQRSEEEPELELAKKILGYDVKDQHGSEHNANNVSDWGKEYLAAREVFDILGDFVSARLSAQELTELLRPLHARYYSISSSSTVCPDLVAATVDVLRYSTVGVEREGVASTFLKDRCQVGETKVGVFISKNSNFRLPADGDRPIIMIGPGTGIAPFIAFLEERLHEGASGPNWLFFGCRHEKQDFLYADQLKEYAADSKLTLKTAFSRDGPQKVYVQHRMAECAKELWELIHDEGAHVYVCGDGGKMAEDVDLELKKILSQEGDMSEDEAIAFVDGLAEQRRYQRDVWVS